MKPLLGGNPSIGNVNVTSTAQAKLAGPSSQYLTQAIGSMTLQVQGNPASNVVSQIQTARWARNGKHPNATLENSKSEAANFAALYRTKEVFRAPGAFFFYAASQGAGDHVRWRWAFHTGPFANMLWAWVVVQPATVKSLNAAARLDLTPVAGGATSSTSFPYGQTPYDAGIQGFKVVPVQIPVLPDTDYTAQLVDTNNSVLQSACIFELASLSQYVGGYLPQNFGQGSPIYADNRAMLADIVSRLWRRGGAQILNWSVDYGSNSTFTTLAYVNVLDNSATPGPLTAGYTLDMTGKARRTQTGGVPVVIAVYGSTSIRTSTISLLNQAGAPVLSATFGGTLKWTFATGFLPAGLAKYDLAISCQANSTALDAVSIYEYEA